MALNQDNSSEWGDMNIRGLLFQWTSTIRGVTKYKFMCRKDRQGVWGQLKVRWRSPESTGQSLGGGSGGKAPLTQAIFRILNGTETVFFRKLRQLNQQYLRHLSTIKRRIRKKTCLKTAVKIDEQRPDV